MSDTQSEVVEDRKKLLSSADHMRDMEHLPMEVVSLHRPFPSVTRVTGRIAPRDPAGWGVANVAVRLDVAEVEGHRPVSRVYTIRSYDPETNLVEIDFVMHENGPAMTWLAGAKPGSELWMTGPRAHLVPDFEQGRHVSLFADETAIPAVYSILNTWPEGIEGTVWVETDDRAAFDELPAIPGVALCLLPRPANRPAGTTGRLVAAARRALAADPEQILWAAGERQEMREIRTLCREHGVERDDTRIMGYWKLGMSSSEIDRRRLEVYETLRASGRTLADMSDEDLPI